MRIVPTQDFGLAQGLGAGERAHPLGSDASPAAGGHPQAPTSLATVSFSLKQGEYFPLRIHCNR